MTLQEIGLKHGTDKAITHFYCDNYEKYFSQFRNEHFVMWEIGVAGGASLRMWREYFPKATIIGIDNNPDCHQGDKDIYIGDQTDQNFINKVLEVSGYPFIVIDDASHFGPYTIMTFEILFKCVSPNGWYVVEDTHCFYDKTYGQAINFNNSEVFNFFSSLARDVDVAGIGMTGNTGYALSVSNPNFPPVPKYSPILDSMYIHPSLWFFKRKQ